MINRRRIELLEQQAGAGQPRVVWVDQGETLEQACKRQGIRYDRPITFNTGIDKVSFVGWQR